MLTASVENMLVTSIDTTLEIGVITTQYIVIISTVRRQSEVGIQRWIDVGPIVNFCLGWVGMWQWMKHGSTIIHLKQKNRLLSGQQLIKSIQNVFCLSTILRNVKLLRSNITWHYWINRAQISRKNGLRCKRKKCCSTKTMHRATSPWKRWSNWMN